jgi:fumarate reductase flavoprotein subunit
MSQDRSSNGITRRGFIKGTAAGVGAVTFLGVGSRPLQAAPPPPKWEQEVNILIAGAGVAGCAAAIAAKDAGETSILVLEKMPYPGGAGSLSSGTVLAAGTPLQKEKGIKDSPELWYKDVMATSANGINQKLAKKLVDSALDTYNFLYNAGLRWSIIDPLPGYSADRCYREANGGAKLMKAMVGEVKKRGIKIQLETRVTKLFVDSCSRSFPQGEVVGVECVGEKGKVMNIKVKKAVAICTGDFSANAEYIESHFPELKGSTFVGHPGNTGDGIKMAQKLGADITGYSPEGHPHCVEVAPGKAILWCRYDLLSRDGMILVNRDGKRFCEEIEKGHYTPLLPEVQKQGNVFSCVFDEAIAKKIMANSRFATNFRGQQELFAKGLKGEGTLVKKAATLEELAQKLGVSTEGLKKTVAAYNQAVDKGTDPEFRRDPKYLAKIDTPPFYGWKGMVGIVMTMGGLRTDEEARIIDADLKPIPRLYGAGHTTGGYTNSAGYRSGWHLTNALTFGRVAGKNMAATKPWA